MTVRIEDGVRGSAAGWPRGPVAWGLLSATLGWTVVVLGHLSIFDLPPWLVLGLVALAVALGGYGAVVASGKPGHGTLAGVVAGASLVAVLATRLDLAPRGWLGAAGWMGPLVIGAGTLGLSGGVLGSRRSAAMIPSRRAVAAPMVAAVLLGLLLLFLAESSFGGRAAAALDQREGALAIVIWPLVAVTELFSQGARDWLDALAGIVAVAWLVSLLSARASRRVAGLAALGFGLFLIQSLSGGVLAQLVPKSSPGLGEAAASESAWLGVATGSWLHFVLKPWFLVLMVASVVADGVVADGVVAGGVVADGVVADRVAVDPVSAGETRGIEATAISGLRSASAHDRVLASLVVVLLSFQATLGSAQKLVPSLQVFHILLGVTVILPIVVHTAIRGALLAQGLRRGVALSMGVALVVQVAVGLAAFAIPAHVDWGPLEGLLDLTLITLHQGLAAVLLGLAAALWAWR